MNPASAAGSVAVYKPPITVNDPGDILPCGHPAQCARSVNVITGATGRDVFTYHGCQWCDDLGELHERIVKLEEQVARRPLSVAAGEAPTVAAATEMTDNWRLVAGLLQAGVGENLTIRTIEAGNAMAAALGTAAGVR